MSEKEEEEGESAFEMRPNPMSGDARNEPISRLGDGRKEGRKEGEASLTILFIQGDVIKKSGWSQWGGEGGESTGAALISVCYFDFSWFERLTMTVILLNCATLGMFQPCEDTVCDSQRCKILKVRRGEGLITSYSLHSLHLSFRFATT